MCFLCDRAVAQRQGLIGGASFSVGLALSTDPVPTQALISQASAQFSQQLTAADGVMDLYLHAPGGAIEVSGGGFGTQTIQSVPITTQDQDFIRSMVKRLDSIIDLDFSFVGEASQADTAFYYDQEIDVGGDGKTLGLAASGSAGWELFVNYPEVADNWDYRQYVNVHEWGHSLGLEHPFEAGDGDTYDNNADPWTSAFPEQTVMAYRSPESGDWPDFFTTSDLNSLIQIWGAEKQILSNQSEVIIGENYGEYLLGMDGDDRLIGAGGPDELNGNSGEDWLQGAWGHDILRGGAGNDVIKGGDGHDLLIGGGGNDNLTGGGGGDRFQMSFGEDQISDFSGVQGDVIEISRGQSYSLRSIEGDIQILTSQGSLLLSGFDFDLFDPIAHIAIV